jgi:hypothetical protein
MLFIAEGDHGIDACGVACLAEHVNARCRTEPGKRRKAVHADRTHAGKTGNSTEKLLEESEALLVSAIFRGRKRNLEGEQMTRIKTSE